MIVVRILGTILIVIVIVVVTVIVIMNFCSSNNDSSKTIKRNCTSNVFESSCWGHLDRQ